MTGIPKSKRKAGTVLPGPVGKNLESLIANFRPGADRIPGFNRYRATIDLREPGRRTGRLRDMQATEPAPF